MSDAILTLRYFASLREALGTGEETLPLPPGVDTVATLRAHLAARGGVWQRLTEMRNLRCAVDQQMADDRTLLSGRAEVAFFPPVTGG